ncbi:MAG: Hpt domain-containing protein [Bdellovibrionaceae bacterium]|nr:Hpt domain-containing protein [Pseudobdellovibrionaceae bacterium]
MKFQYALFDTLLEPVFVVNAEGKVVYCNEPAALICELSVRKISRGLFFKDLLKFNVPIDGLDRLPTVTDPTPYKELNFESPAGQKGKVQVTLQPIQNESAEPNWIIFVRDVTLEERLQQKYRGELEQKEDVIVALQKAQSELEQYSKNLEHMVAERTQQISYMNRQMKALLDSLSQGFFIFDNKGICLEVSSKACETTLEQSPPGKMIWDVLKLQDKQVDGFKKWMTTLFSEMLPFEDLAPLGPETYPHSQNHNISLDYFPLRGGQNQIEGVVVVATDVTSLVEARKQAETEKAHAKLIIHMVQSKNEMGRFIRESQFMMKELREVMAAPHTEWDLESVFRTLHTLKGGSGIFSIHKVAESCHFAETRLTEYKETRDPVKADMLKSQCQAVELQFKVFLKETSEVLGASILSDERMLEVKISDVNSMLDKLVAYPQAKVIVENNFSHLLYEPIRTFFAPYKDVAEKVAEKENKVLRAVEFKNDMIPVVPEIYGPLFATFVHAFRNAVDHGIETPSARYAQQKPEGGKISVKFERQDLPSPILRITLHDDGGGVDAQKIRAKLTAKGMDVTAETDEQVIQHLFDSQFSTKEKITETSGRGVGLDAIKHEALLLGGKVWMETILAAGSTLIVEVPYITKVPGPVSVNAA